MKWLVAVSLAAVVATTTATDVSRERDWLKKPWEGPDWYQQQEELPLPYAHRGPGVHGPQTTIEELSRKMRRTSPYADLTETQPISSQNATVNEPIVTEQVLGRKSAQSGQTWVDGRVMWLHNPHGHFSIFPPEGGCGNENRQQASVTATARHCFVTTNAGFFDTTNFSCLGNLVSNGTVIQNPGTLNANFGVTKDGQIKTGYFDARDVTKGDFLNLVGGVIWLVRDGQNFVVESGQLEDMNTQTTGDAARFESVMAPRTALGHDREGRIFVAIIDGDSKRHTGTGLVEFADLLISLGAVNAINLDGGGSTTMVENLALTNYPSDFCENNDHLAGRCERQLTSVTCFHALDPDSVVPPMAQTTWPDETYETPGPSWSPETPTPSPTPAPTCEPCEPCAPCETPEPYTCPPCETPAPSTCAPCETPEPVVCETPEPYTCPPCETPEPSTCAPCETPEPYTCPPCETPAPSTCAPCETPEPVVCETPEPYTCPQCETPQPSTCAPCDTPEPTTCEPCETPEPVVCDTSTCAPCETPEPTTCEPCETPEPIVCETSTCAPCETPEPVPCDSATCAPCDTAEPTTTCEPCAPCETSTITTPAESSPPTPAPVTFPPTPAPTTTTPTTTLSAECAAQVKEWENFAIRAGFFGSLVGLGVGVASGLILAVSIRHVKNRREAAGRLTDEEGVVDMALLDDMDE